MSQQPSTNNYQLKVCGLTKMDQIQELISLNTDFLGFIFYEKSPRFVLNHLSLKEISEINHQGKVGVFVNETVEKISEISEKAKLSFIQLHGDEDEKFILQLRQILGNNIKIIKVIRIGNQSFDELQKTINQQPSSVNYLLFDTDSKAFGGTGKTFDWQILNEIEIPIPYFLSGGISLENIKNLQNFVKVNMRENKTLTKLNTPFALDINSKFEIEPGSKDLEKIKTFKSLLK
jgi:phosphoribosylanthranilate isomerase